MRNGAVRVKVFGTASEVVDSKIWGSREASLLTGSVCMLGQQSLVREDVVGGMEQESLAVTVSAVACLSR
jgi:hypothetical protein